MSKWKHPREKRQDQSHVKRKRSDIELCHIIYKFLRESSFNMTRGQGGEDFEA